jgi:DNA adenine methylase
MKITAIAPWFGSNRIAPERVGREIGKVAWCGIAAMGGGPELPHIKTRGGVANDLHRQIINLARVIADPELKAQLHQQLDGLLFHPDELAQSQARLSDHQESCESGLFNVTSELIADSPNVDRARDYFVAVWMGRGAEAGKTSELDQPLSVRWTSSGGSSSRRFRSAIESIEAWHKALQGWEFTCMDGLAFIDKAKDEEGHALYIDWPWPDAGKDYLHRVPDDFHRRARDRVLRFEKTRVVIRYGDHPLIRELYPESIWQWHTFTGRTQANKDAPELLLINSSSKGLA